MKKSFNIADINNQTAFNKKFATNRNIQIVGKQVASVGQRKKLNVAQANKRLAGNRLGVEDNFDPASDDAALLLLETIGCAIGKRKKDFSFLDEQETDAEDLDNENPNIADSGKLRRLQNKQKEARGTHPNEDDPFYQMDEDIPRKNKLQNRDLDKQGKANAVIKLAADLSAENLKGGKSLKHFKR